MLKRIERRLSGCSTLLSYGEKLTIIKSAFTSLPTFFMSSLALPATVIDQINKYIKHCFWRKYGLEDQGSPLIAWEKVCKPKDQGGLGVLDIATHNKALLMKHLHKFLNGHNLPWVHLIWDTYYNDSPLTDRPVGSFWWRAILKLLTEFKSMATCSVSKGNSALFWQDNWSTIALKDKFPELFCFAINELSSVKQVVEIENLQELFHRPLFVQAYAQFQEIQVTLTNTTFNQAEDVWNYSWNSTTFSMAKLYNALIHGEKAHPIFNQMWKSAVIQRYKIFCWFLLHNRLNTRSLLRRKSMYLPSYHCALYTDQTKETALHLFWDCSFALQCWDLIIPNKKRDTSVLHEFILALRELSPAVAMTIIIMGCWHIWMQRNNKIFNQINPSIASWKLLLKKDLLLLKHRIKQHHLQVYQNWIDSSL